MSVVDVDIDRVEEFLSHHGVKGQHWGIRNIRKNIKLNRASRKTERLKENETIDKARAKTKGTTVFAKLGFGDKGSKSFKQYKDAKHKYKHERFEIGTREAKKTLSKVRDQRFKDIENAHKLKNGKEKTIAALALVGVLGLKAAIDYKTNEKL